jgi:hypothetical protein
MWSPSASERGRELERDVFVRNRALTDGDGAKSAQCADNIVDEGLRRGCAGGQPDATSACKQLGRDVTSVLDERRAASSPFGDLDKPL